MLFVYLFIYLFIYLFTYLFIYSFIFGVGDGVDVGVGDGVVCTWLLLFVLCWSLFAVIGGFGVDGDAVGVSGVIFDVALVVCVRLPSFFNLSPSGAVCPRSLLRLSRLRLW